ncbi:MAG: arginine-tRNA-protein transferase, partial [bacterium]
MKLLFSEYKSDYSNYIFPYAIWAIPEAHETPAMIFARGFLPSTRELSRFYLCRQVRVQLKRFNRSSENRRIFRKCEDIQFRLIARTQFD